VTFLEKHLEDPVRFARVKRWFYAGLAALLIIEVASLLFLYPDHGHFWFEDLPAWGSLYGLASCVAIIVLSKLVGRLWLMRRETYYDS
jgi:hypothetical protein